MLNEFITIWDTLGVKHLSEPFNIGDHNLEFPTANRGKGWGLPVSLISERDDLTVVPYIGKTDDTPEQNKIYADCSIVELNLKNYDSLVHTKSKYLGFFTYSEASLSFVFITTNHKGEDIVMQFSILHIDNLKVIGNIQQDKHLLDRLED